jgi:hypothetical protein
MERKKTDLAVNIIMAGTVIFELLILLYFNFFKVRMAVDQDYAQLLFHAIEMGNKHKLLLDNWLYSTTGEFDSPMLLAALFYDICGDVYLGYALSNLINILLWVFVINTLIDNVGGTVYEKFMAMALVFTTYDFSILAYTNMMFIRGSQYTMKVLLPVMMITVLTFPKDKLRSKKSIFLTVVFYLMTLLTAFSSGSYVFLNGYTAVIFCTIMYYILNKNCLNKRFYVIHLVSVFATTFLGLVLGKIFEISTKSDSFMIRNDIDIIEALGNSIGDLFWALRLFPDYGVSVGDVEAIGIVLRWAVIALICFGFASIKKAFGFDQYGKNQDTIDEKSFAEAALISVFVTTILLLTLIPSRIRYQLIGLIPLMLVAALNVEKWMQKVEDAYKKFFYVICAVLFIANSCFSISYDAKLWLAGEKSGYQVDYEVNEAIAQLLDDNQVDLAYVYEDNRIRAGMTLADPDRRYAVCNSDGSIWIGWDNYIEIAQSNESDFGSRNAIILGEHGELPEYFQNYSVIGNIGEYEIWVSDSNLFE